MKKPEKIIGLREAAETTEFLRLNSRNYHAQIFCDLRSGEVFAVLQPPYSVINGFCNGDIVELIDTKYPLTEKDLEQLCLTALEEMP